MKTSASRGRGEPPASSKEGGAVKRIALIEDDADIAYTIRLNLRKEKRYQVEHYVSGVAALAALHEKPFDLVILERGAGGHVGFYAGYAPNGDIQLLGGNQGNTVSIASFPTARVLGIRRIWE